MHHHSQFASKSARMETLSKQAARALAEGRARVKQRGKATFVYIEAHGNHSAKSVQVMTADELVASMASEIRGADGTLGHNVEVILDRPAMGLAYDVSGLTIDELKAKLQYRLTEATR